MFSCEFCDIFRTPFLIEHLWWLLLSREINSCSQVFCKKSCSERFSWKTRPMTLLRWTQFFSCKFWKGSRKTFSKNTSSSRLKFVSQFTALYISIIKSALCEVSFSEFFWSVFPRIWTEYGETLAISPCPVRIWEYTNQKSSEYGHFLRSGAVSVFEKQS